MSPRRIDRSPPADLYEETPAERALRQRCDELEARLAEIEVATGLYASDKDLDSPRGDPKINFDPRGWRGKSWRGRRMSEADPDYLAAYAEALSWMADHPQAGKEQYVDGNRRDAKRARSWGRRKRAGWVKQAPAGFEGGSTSFASTSFADPLAGSPKTEFASTSFASPSFDTTPPPAAADAEDLSWLDEPENT